MLRRDMAKLVLVVVFFAVSFFLLADVIGFDSPWLGLLLMFYFMGLAKVAEPLFALRMPAALRDVDPASATAPLYRRLGVHRFGSLLRNTPLRYLNASVYRLGGKRSLAAVQAKAESAEATHFWAALLFTPYIVYVGARGHLAEAALFAAVQIAFNVYPILHLRIVRARLKRVGASGDVRKNAMGARTTTRPESPAKNSTSVDPSSDQRRERLRSLLEEFLRQTFPSLGLAQEIEGLIATEFSADHAIQELANELAQYRPGGGDMLYSEHEMRPKVAAWLARLPNIEM
ncbi:hypothetical protein [Lysobacter sp. Root983]|uniref:glycosyl-4,4'-diaponeurosporenoate acyltransferase CrtO family protein n=1 Tax=Lysobacter sp. Root983 TaxID=1736613 RepID=UPI00070C53D4|nr:hypothetical protein [Lysobacter sp. Root983]KRD73548.1 hypothetical protein ASE43_18235 [Lysobacter sp. Root983]